MHPSPPLLSMMKFLSTSLSRIFEKYSKTPLKGYFVLGSNGESKCCTETEKLQILELVLKEKSPNQVIMAGAGYESTRQTIEFSKKVASMGADFVSLVTPSYFKKSLTDDVLIGYYKDVAEAVPVPVLIYNAPGFTGITVSPKVVEVLSQHPNIAGMKDTSPGNIANYLDVSARRNSRFLPVRSISFSSGSPLAPREVWSPLPMHSLSPVASSTANT